jgi:hypothetical protein
MGKQSAGSPGSRSEPYNQPIKIYGPLNLDGKPELNQVMDEFGRRIRDRKLGRTVDARVGNNIAFTRARAGFGVPEFARRLRISVARLERIEAGKERLTLSLVERIAAALGCFLSVELV